MSRYCCRPATDGSLDKHAPLIEIPEGIPTNAQAADDLPYYIVTVVDDEDATSAPAQPAPAASTQVLCPEIAPIAEHCHAPSSKLVTV